MSKVKKPNKRKSTAAELVRLPDYMKLQLWDSHAEIIAEACGFEWVEGEPDDTPPPKSPPKSPYEKQVDIISQQWSSWVDAGYGKDEKMDAFMWEWAYQQFHNLEYEKS